MEIKEKHFGPIWFIPGENSGKYPNCHSIYIDGPGILIDPASNRKRLVQLKKNPGVQEVWLSHWHEDHFMHLDLFDDLPLSMSEPDALPLSDLDILMEAYGVDEKFKETWRALLKDFFHFRPRKPSRFLTDGQSISLGSITVDVIQTPGHTPGHLCFFFQEQGILFLGDYDLTKFGPWYGDVDSCIEKTITSVQHLKEISATTWLTSHETGIFENNPGELWLKYLSVIEQREEKLLYLLKTPQSLDDIVKACIIYGKPRKPKYFFEFGEQALMQKHIERLINQCIIALENGKYFIKQIRYY